MTLESHLKSESIVVQEDLSVSRSYEDIFHEIQILNKPLFEYLEALLFAKGTQIIGDAKINGYEYFVIQDLTASSGKTLHLFQLGRRQANCYLLNYDCSETSKKGRTIGNHAIFDSNSGVFQILPEKQKKGIIGLQLQIDFYRDDLEERNKGILAEFQKVNEGKWYKL